mmetsp:Transcript_22291/g.43952  ORF Transcript_22291/g.43952 Transcript_22291/m.43952 type:complete len:103 (+) Transcript_22291:3291-3599(+)
MLARKKSSSSEGLSEVKVTPRCSLASAAAAAAAVAVAVAAPSGQETINQASENALHVAKDTKRERTRVDGGSTSIAVDVGVGGDGAAFTNGGGGDDDVSMWV